MYVWAAVVAWRRPTTRTMIRPGPCRPFADNWRTTPGQVSNTMPSTSILLSTYIHKWVRFAQSWQSQRDFRRSGLRWSVHTYIHTHINTYIHTIYTVFIHGTYIHTYTYIYNTKYSCDMENANYRKWVNRKTRVYSSDACVAGRPDLASAGSGLRKVRPPQKWIHRLQCMYVCMYVYM